MKLKFRSFCIALLISAISQPAHAQNADANSNPSNQTDDALAPLSTLKDIRSKEAVPLQDNFAGGMGMASGMPAEMSMGQTIAQSGKQLLLQRINELRQLLNAPNQDRKELEEMLRGILAEYFVLDMEDRVREFDKIKARVAQMESKLQTRLDRRYEVVELQIKQMLYKADGLDFFVPEGEGGAGGGMVGADMGTMGAMGGMGSMDAGGGGMGTGMGMGVGMAGMGGEDMVSMGGAAGGMGGMMMGAGSGSMGIPNGPGYDIGYGLTRYLRFPGKPLKPNDPLQYYLTLNANSDRENELSKISVDVSDEEKLKYLVLALHNFQSMFKHFPAPVGRRYRTEQPHSWRVALLPILGHAELYKQYRFDQPWDSEINLKLIEQMPAIFGSKDDPDSKKGKTRFQMIVGNGAAFNLSRPTEIREITDGTSNTIALAVAVSGVPWTKPEDIPFVPNATLSKLAAPRMIGMCDGSVRQLPAGGERVLTNFVTRDGGEQNQ